MPTKINPEIFRAAGHSPPFIHHTDEIAKLYPHYQKDLSISKIEAGLTSQFKNVGLQEMTGLASEVSQARKELDEIVKRIKPFSITSSHYLSLDGVLKKYSKLDAVNPTSTQVQEFKNAIKAFEQSLKLNGAI